MINQYSVNIFYSDQWDFMIPLFKNDSLWSMFNWQHGPHRMGLALPLLNILYGLTHWNVRADSFFILFILTMAMFLAFWLKYKLFLKYTIYDLIIPLIFLNTVNDAIINVPHLAHSVLPLFLIIIYCLCWLIKNNTIKYALVLITNFFLIYTGFGFFMGLITILLFIGEIFRKNYPDKKNYRLIIFAGVVALISFGSFFINYKFTPAAPFILPSFNYIGNYLIFIINMLSSSWGVYILPDIIKYVLLSFFLLTVCGVFFICLKNYLQVKSTETSIYQISTILIGFSLLFMFSTAIGRISLGSHTGVATRYATLLIPMYLGIYFYANTTSEKIKKYFLPSYFAIIFIATILIVPIISNNICNLYKERKQNWINNYLHGYSMEECQMMNYEKYKHNNSYIYPNEILLEDKNRFNLFNEQLKYLKDNKLSFFAK